MIFKGCDLVAPATWKGDQKMERYDYFEAVKEDLKDYVAECVNWNNLDLADLEDDRTRDSLYDEAFISDSVTGNASGSYTFNTWKAEENICHNLDLATEAFREYGYDGINTDSAETIDVTIRCYVLGQVFEEAFKEIAEELEEITA